MSGAGYEANEFLCNTHGCSKSYQTSYLSYGMGCAHARLEPNLGLLQTLPRFFVLKAMESWAGPGYEARSSERQGNFAKHSCVSSNVLPFQLLDAHNSTSLLKLQFCIVVLVYVKLAFCLTN